MDVQLVLFRADGKRKDLNVKGDSATIGRSSGCTFRIGLADISRRHCQLLKKGENLIVRDLGSSNGTFLNDKRVLQSDVKAGDKLRVGPVVMTIVINGAPVNVEPTKTIFDGKKKIDEKTASASGSAILKTDDSDSGTDLLALMDAPESSSADAGKSGSGSAINDLVKNLSTIDMDPKGK